VVGATVVGAGVVAAVVVVGATVVGAGVVAAVVVVGATVVGAGVGSAVLGTSVVTAVLCAVHEPSHLDEKECDEADS
jgi:hypothetical protein